MVRAHVHRRKLPKWPWLVGALLLLGALWLVAFLLDPEGEIDDPARLSTEGQLYTCLFASRGHDLRALMRGGADDDELASAMASIWGGRSDRYSEIRSGLTPCWAHQEATVARSCGSILPVTR